MSSNFLPGAIIFDFDGTMVDSETATLGLAIPIISRHLGSNVHEIELEVLKGRVWKEEFQFDFPILVMTFTVKLPQPGKWQIQISGRTMAYLECSCISLTDRFPWP